MKFSTILLVIIVAFNSVSLQASPILLDTVYLDNAWKQVDGPCFASYYKYVKRDAEFLLLQESETSISPEKFKVMGISLNLTVLTI